jgi:hypothetical protein
MITKKNKHKWDQKSRILKSKKLGIGFQYVNPDMKSYDPVYTIIENPALNKRVLDFKLMRTILKKYHLRECNQWECMKQKPMYIWLNFDENSMHNLKRKYYKTPIYLLNSLDKTESISSKELLHLGMKEHFPEIYTKHIAESFLLKKDWILPKTNKEIYIARPINVLPEHRKAGESDIASGGKDIIVIDDNNTLGMAKKNLEKYDNVLISKYIRNPLLFNGRKFHIRTLLMASLIDSVYNTYMLDWGRIFTAKLPFVLEDFNNKQIHDTHRTTTDDDYFFPLDFTNANMGRDDIDFEVTYNIFKQIKLIFTSVSKLLSTTISNYDNVKNGFTIFGVDLMICDDLSVVLIEVNTEGGFTFKEKETRNKVESLLFNWVDDVILEKVFTKPRKVTFSSYKTSAIYTKKNISNK